MAFQPNEQQRAAIDEFAFDLLVSAGAGSGKTAVLAQKYLKLLEDGLAEVNQIVAITFTKKAAGEMCDRIRREIRERYEQAVDSERARFWRKHLDQIENAKIMTFHGFCLWLIREYPVEAGITPATGVLDDGEENLLLMQAINAVLTAAFNDARINIELLTRLVFESDWSRFEKSLAMLYRKVRESGLDFNAVAELSNGNLHVAIERNPVEVSHFCAEVAELLEFAPTQKLTDRAKELIGDLGRKWPEYRQLLTDAGELDALLATLAEIKKALPKNLPACIKERVVEIHRLAEACSNKLLDREALERTALLVELLERIDRGFSDAKASKAVLDFTDQQLLARNLLRRNPEITAKIRQGISYIMVDEFQDTNDLQLELIERLIEGDASDRRLMVVGDIKQSIYRFRGAEARVILSMEERMRAGRGRVIPLTCNYRSAQLVIRFVNQLSERLFAGESFAYEPLQSTQPDQGAQLELIYSSTDLLEQARMVARRIAGLVRESRGTEFPIGYKDIVLLFRAGTAMPLFQQALQEQGIPYYAAGGGRFYQRQEVVDQLNLLRLVQQRYDGVALCGLLTSPYVGLTEEQLAGLSQGRPLVEQFYETETVGGLLPAVVRERLIRFRKLLLFLQESRELLDIPGIIRLALERLDYRELLWTMPHAGQRLANLEKLLFKADEFAAKDYHQLGAFLAYLKELEAIEVREGEAQTQAEASDVVQLMTIHRSKGLEFPVVILPDLDRRFPVGATERFSFHKDVGIGFKIPVENAEPGETSLWRWIKELDKQEETAELKRVLYVALTRAEQRLILVGSGVNAAKDDTLATANSWMKWLNLLLPKVDNEATELDFNGIPIRIIRDLPEEVRPGQGQTLLDLYAPQLDTSLIEVAHAEVAAAVASPAMLAVNLKVSGVVAYKECPRRFYLKYWLNLPEIRGQAAAGERDRPGDALGAQIGVFLHQAVRLKPLDVWPEQLWRQTFGHLTGATAEKLQRDVQLMWQNFRRSEFSREGCQIWDEVPFQLKLSPNLRVEGRFDRLLRHDDGELVLVDYKTHRAGVEKVSAIAPQYFWQLQLYALAIEAIWGRKPDRAILYFVYSDTGVTVPLDEVALEATVGEVKTLGRLLAGPGRRLDDFPKNESACEHCSYGWFCQKKVE